MLNTAFPKISFIITSVDRDQELQRCIVSVEKAREYKQSIPIEILVIIQKAKQKKDICIRYPEIITFYYMDKVGLSAGRNFAIEKSAGEYLVFLDDDAVINEDFLNVLSENIATVGASAFCCRDTDPLKNRLYSGRFLENTPKSLNLFEFVYFAGYAHVLKKSAIKKIGIYDEKFGIGAKYPAAEESDIFFRLKRRGEEVVYLSGLVVYHPIVSITSELKRFNYSYAMGAMLIKHMFLDRRHFVIYLFIISEIIFKSFLRTLQTIFFLKSLEDKDKIFRYRSVLIGTVKGAWNYTWNL